MPARLPSSLFLFGALPLAAAAQFAPAAGQPGSTAIPHSDSRIVAWASEVVEGSYQPGFGVFDIWKDASRALGPARPPDDKLHVVSLGERGQITLGFDQPIGDGPGPDFAVFENGFFSDQSGLAFLELAFVEVSSDGVNFLRFPSTSLGDTPIPIGGSQGDATLIDGLAGKYTAGFGTPFDLATLRELPDAAQLNFNAVRYVRIVDIQGDGQTLDSQGEPIFDPYTEGVDWSSNGFDLDAIGLLNGALETPILADVFVADGALRLSWTVPSGENWSIFVSSDLEQWTHLRDIQSTNGQVDATFPIEAAPRFYQLRPAP